MSVTLHTSHGDVCVKLYCRQCPKACFNFLALCASGYYDGSTFHRSVPNFIVQGGDPTGTGKGGVSCFPHQPYFEDEGFGETFHNKRGVLSMAHK